MLFDLNYDIEFVIVLHKKNFLNKQKHNLLKEIFILQQNISLLHFARRAQMDLFSTKTPANEKFSFEDVCVCA